MYISKIELKNIRCFKELTINLEQDGKPILWTTILGDNATGKTTLLRSIAMGVCDESSAAGLLKESEKGCIRHDEDNASISITLKEKNDSEKIYEIITVLENFKTKGGRYFERLRQTTSPPEIEFPWDKIFACAYGADRGTIGTGDIAGYSTISAVHNIFDYEEGLQNPELTIRRVKKLEIKDDILLVLNRLMKTKKIHLPDSGIEIDGPWGNPMPLRDLADGYKSTFLWITDLFGWALSYNPELNFGKEIAGVVLLDELEQHLHPKWQRTIIESLKEEFPNVQFIITTHSPIVAANASKLLIEDIDSKVLHAKFDDETVIISEVEEKIAELDFDQVLSSEAFDYIFSIRPEVEKVLRDASALASIDEPTSEEEAKLNEFISALKNLMFPKGRTLIERIVEREYYKELEENIENFEKILEEKRND